VSSREASSGPAVIGVRHLRKSYEDTVAVDDVSFTVAEGEIFGILGPNGAGKTTTVECVEGLRRPDGGSQISVLGLDPRRDRAELTQRLGVQLQDSQLPNKLRVGEALRLYSSFYRTPADWHALMDALGLTGKENTAFGKLSGGQKQRLSIALALVGSPQVAVLDELTTGLDPQARRDTWELVEGVRDRGVTIVLVSHFMEEAERLCDRVALFDSGRLVVVDTPAALAGQVQAGQRIQFRPSVSFDDGLLSGLPEVASVSHQGDVVVVTGNGNLLNAVVSVLARDHIEPRQLRAEQASLEDAFLALTGRHAGAVMELPPEPPSPEPAVTTQPATTTTTAAATARGAALWRLTLTELKLFMREPAWLAWAVLFPMLLLIIFGAIPAFKKPQAALGGYPTLDAYVPILIVFMLALLSLLNMPIVLAGYRERGILRRLQTTPAGPGLVLAAQLLVNLAVAVVVTVLLLVVARSGYHVPLPRQFAGWVIAALLATAGLMAIGLVIAAAAPSARTAQVIGMLLFYPLLFFSGIWYPIPMMTPVLQHISHATPLGAAWEAMADAGAGSWPPALPLVTLAAYAAASGVLAASWFRWE
jgi:ABC-2 type transport system ATP-binding protein